MNKVISSLLCAVAFFATAAGADAQYKTSKDFPDVTIKNFGQMDDRFFRGGQPTEDNLAELKKFGVKTVINLRMHPMPWEKAAVEALGMKYVELPMHDNSYPDYPVGDKFMEIVNDPDTGVMFVHCKGGKHRTGAMGAVYRFQKYDWNYDQAYKEMKAFNFYTFLWMYKPVKKYVQDYAKKEGKL